MSITDAVRRQFSGHPNSTSRQVTVGVIAFLVALILGYAWRFNRTPSLDDLLDGVPVHADMAEHSLEFNVPQVYKVTDSVYVAVGFALANSILIEGPEGLIIVDTTESRNAAREIYTEFRKVSPHKPVKAIVYTHNHFDHCLGTEVFLENATDPVDIWGHYTLKDRVMEVLLTLPRLSWGARHQLGNKLGKHLVNAGLGPGFRVDDEGGIFPLFPNKFITTDVQHERIAGLNVTFLHIPGETPDQIAVWLPDQRVLLPADDIYKTFPNLYAIRGTPPRDTTDWFRSLDRMRALGAEHLVPSHTRPVSGADRIDDMFRVYSAAIEYIHDQSVRLLNAGATPDEIAKSVRLPPELAGHRYLSEFYGTAEWSARGVYERYIGWFGGDPVDLRPLEPRDRSDRYVRLAGGTRKILQTAEAAVKAGQFQWALELATHAYRAAGGRRDGGREWRAARDVRAKALRGLAGIERNPVARNYYLTALAEDYVDFRPAAEDQRRAVDAASAKLLFDLMKVRLIPDHLIGVNWTIVFHFTDTKQTFVLRLRHCVMRVEETAAYDGPMDAGVDTTLTTWKSVMTGRRNAFLAYFSGEIVVKGHLTTLLKFLSSFQKN